MFGGFNIFGRMVHNFLSKWFEYLAKWFTPKENGLNISAKWRGMEIRTAFDGIVFPNFGSQFVIIVIGNIDFGVGKLEKALKH